MREDRSVCIVAIVLGQLLFFITLDVLLADCLLYATLDATGKICSYLFTFHVLIEHQQKLDFLG